MNGIVSEIANVWAVSWELFVILCIFAALSGVVTVKLDQYKNESETND